jgi:hypothetical protein
MDNSTLSHSEFQKLHQAEESLQKTLKDSPKKPEAMNGPSELTISNVLAYSQALSVRKSDHVDFIENLLN